MNLLFVWNFVASIVSYFTFHNFFNEISLQTDELLFKKKCLDLLYGKGIHKVIQSPQLQDEIIEFNRGKTTKSIEIILKIGCTTYEAGKNQGNVCLLYIDSR